jgi:endogenous inhibitor of DNA gyrase (YacG/DUF329 family)
MSEMNKNQDALPVKRVVCPGCGEESIYAPSNPFRPFCSKRCKNIDLGAWASEEFRLPEQSAPDEGFPGDPKLQ